ncbi:hypothetical protein ACR3S4_05590 [Streptomyces sp. CH8.1]|uniref:hypothetical protein n=1 Tax=Streptomyces sp. CH8.1 TaxID=3439546 RepID=UPI003DA0B1D6
MDAVGADDRIKPARMILRFESRLPGWSCRTSAVWKEEESRSARSGKRKEVRGL